MRCLERQGVVVGGWGGGGQGIVGNIPGTALGFVTLYVQLLGLSDLSAGVMVALGMAANAVGGLLGGWLGDLASRASPNHGRILVCQISIIASALLISPLSRLPF